MLVEILDGGILDSNSYVIWDETTKEGAIIDAGVEASQVSKVITKNNITPMYIILTHCHFDHIYHIQEIKNLTNAKIAIHTVEEQAFMNPSLNGSAHFMESMTFGKPDILLNDGDILKLGLSDIEIIHCPGHSAGGICIKADKYLFSGDTLFKGTIGRTDLMTSNPKDIVTSIEKRLFTLSEDTIVYPGHGPSTTIAFEKKHNRIFHSLSNQYKI
jgi:glyoxylase-like metal-dependent hydrolase (beta-lactamase superfamily II)